MLFFTADHHFNHTRIIEYCNRPFATVEAMNEALVERWNAVVRPDDTVLHLGDLSFDGPRWAERLNGMLWLCPGNHDRCHPVHHRWKREVKRYWDHGIEVVNTQGVQSLPVYVNAGFVMFSHFPFAGDSQPEDRYTRFRPTELQPPARVLLHGHVHTAWKRRGNCINVGVDVWDYAPVSVDRLVDYCRVEGVL